MNTHTHRITVSRDVKFLETDFTRATTLTSNTTSASGETAIGTGTAITAAPEISSFESTPIVVASIPTTDPKCFSTPRSTVPPPISVSNSFSPLTDDDSPATVDLEEKYDSDNEINTDTTTTSVGDPPTPTSIHTSDEATLHPAIDTPTTLEVDGVTGTIPPPITTRSGRTSRPVSRFGIPGNDLHPEDRFYAAVVSGNEPQTYKQAMKSNESKLWLAAMQEELAALAKQKTWDLVKCPLGTRPIKGRWVFKVKLDSNNQPIRYKARVVAKGFQQVYGIDYNETFAPVAKLKSIKLVLALVAQFNLEFKQLDFDTAFLNASLTENVYMEQPSGFHQGPPDLVCKLNKALYGLKQAPHEWNQELNSFMLKLGYKPIASDTCVYIKRTGSGRLIILCIYVDDTVSAYDKRDEDEWLADKKKIADQYRIKDLGECEWILNMKVTRDRSARLITLSQEAYVTRVIQQFGMGECKPAPNPEAQSDLFEPADGTAAVPLTYEEHSTYRSLVGALLYAANTTRLDIAHGVGVLSRYVASPAQHHLKAAFHILRYLKGTPNLGLTFSSSTQSINQSIVAYTDASWGNDMGDRKSTTGTVVKFNGNVISWLSKKQSVVATSTTEAEYIALAAATQEILWFRAWIKEVLDVDVVSSLIHSDNQSCIALAKNDVYHSRTKHIDIKYHFIRDHIRKQHLVVDWIRTEEQQADLLTKMLPTKQFVVLRNGLLSVV
jgi:hypothetical protein